MRFATAGANAPLYRAKTAKGWATWVCGEGILAWPKTGFSSRMPARRKRTVIRRRVVWDADMVKLLGTISVCRAEWVVASGLRHWSDVTVVIARARLQVFTLHPWR